MNKWRTTRSIGFDKKNQIAAEAEDTPVRPKKAIVAPKPQTKSLEPATSESLYKWLKSRPLINITGLCKQVGYDQANFRKLMRRGSELNKELLNKTSAILKDYGYAK